MYGVLALREKKYNYINKNSTTASPRVERRCSVARWDCCPCLLLSLESWPIVFGSTAIYVFIYCCQTILAGTRTLFFMEAEGLVGLCFSFRGTRGTTTGFIIQNISLNGVSWGVSCTINKMLRQFLHETRRREKRFVSWPWNLSALFPKLWKHRETCTEALPSFHRDFSSPGPRGEERDDRDRWDPWIVK